MKSQINLQNQNANSIYDDNQAQVKIVAKRQYILDDDVVIAADNIKKIGELIALLTIRTVMCRSGKDLYRLYDGLIQDCNKSNDSLDEYSDGYDIAQTATLFLCEHIGKKLGDNYTTARGSVIPIKQACFRFVDRYLNKQYTRHLMHTTAIDEAATASTITFIDDESNNDYIDVGALIERMHLTQGEYDVLCAYMSGLSNIEIAKLLNVNRTTIWRRKNSFCKKYLQIPNRH
ncbi:MAG: hypothetical protein L6V83_06235 [Christensenella sp.]|nr:MAG: hypothetical protein L6V83_06235 [Christensenella sp.]